METKRVGLFLQKLRHKHRLTQKDISKICNVSPQAVSKWENGDNLPDIEFLEKLSILYDVSINEILDGEEHTLLIDSEQRQFIISLTLSILSLFALFFTYGQMTNMGFPITIKWYQLIINGISGTLVVLSWIQFLILISHIIIFLFILLRVFERNDKIKIILLISSLSSLLIGLVGIVNDLMYIFPQFILAIGLVTHILFYRKAFVSLDKQEGINVLKRAKDNNNVLLLSDDIRTDKLYLFSLIFSLLVIGLNTFILLYISAELVDGLFNTIPVDMSLRIITIAILLGTLSINLYLSRLYKSQHFDQLLIIFAFVNAFPVLIVTLLSPFHVLIFVYLIIFIVTLTLAAYFHLRQKNTTAK